MAKVIKSRYWVSVLYPESMPDNWFEILSEFHVPALLSPLHDQDTNPTGEPKKPHYHLILMYDGPTTQHNAEQVVNALNGAGCFVVRSLRGYARYLCHLDNPEKHIYPEEQIQCFSGADYREIIYLPSDDALLFDQIENFIDSQHIFSFRFLMAYARNNEPLWSDLLRRRATLYFTNYIKSVKWEFDTFGKLLSLEDLVD